MASDAVELADSLVYTVTGRHLNDLQRTILHQVWQGRKYLDIARGAGYTEGHIKDVAYQLWRLLSRVTGEKITKATVKSALKRYLRTRPLGRSDPPLDPLPDLKPESRPSSLVADSGVDVSTADADTHPGFVGRQVALAHLQTLVAQGHRALVIQGEGGLGKTTLAQHFVAQQPVDLTLELLMAKDTADITPVQWVVEEWLRQDFGVEPGREFGVTLDRLKRHLRQRRVAVLIDNLEPSLDTWGKFVPPHRRYGELLRILTEPQSQTITILTSRDRLCEPGLPITHYRLPGLDWPTWKTYFSQRGLTPDDLALAAMHRAYGGNAKAMEILCGAIQSDFGGDLTAYWQTHHDDLLESVDLKNLVESQISRLGQLDPEAYRLFCRLGVYRYQDVPTLPLAGLLALVDKDSPRQPQTMITSLRNRSLLESHRGRYWLHPVVREGAMAHLRRFMPPESAGNLALVSPKSHLGQLAEWQLAHRYAARYWSDSIQRIGTLDDALQALEAYYHCVAIQDFEAAAQVILYSRDNQWQQFLPLGSTLYRMGLVQPATDAITAIIDHIPRHNSDASELYNILGDLFWIQGRIFDAIDCQKSAMGLAQDCLGAQAVATESHRWYYLTMLVVDSQLSLGLYYLDLWELAAAAAWFTQVIQAATGTRHQPWADKATTCLALVKSCQGYHTEAKALATAITERVVGQGASGRHAFFVQLLGHTYLNLGDLAMAQTLLQAAISVAEAGHYQQIKANALSGLGRLEHQAGRWDQAVAYHQEAIALLQEVGAQCDLATAHLQMGMTLAQSPLDRRETCQHFQQAMQIFETIPAPEQMQRMRHC